MNKKTGIRYSVNKRKPIYGWGINDADYVVQPVINGRQVLCPFYSRWVGMLTRVFCPKYKEKNPSYSDCSVHDTWKYFSNFKAWMEEQEWEGNDLDKDVLKPGNKIYGPDHCVFIPPRLNKSLNLKSVSLSSRNLPVGVGKVGLKYIASLSGYAGVRTRIGTFLDAKAAHKAWQMAKSEQLEDTLSWYALQKCFRTDVAEALLQRVWKLRLDNLNDVETVRDCF